MFQDNDSDISPKTGVCGHPAIYTWHYTKYKREHCLQCIIERNDKVIELLRSEITELKQLNAIHSSYVEKAFAMCDVLRSDISSLQKDAERYRWLRDCSDRDDKDCPFIAMDVFTSSEELDNEDPDPDQASFYTMWICKNVDEIVDKAMGKNNE